MNGVYKTTRLVFYHTEFINLSTIEINSSLNNLPKSTSFKSFTISSHHSITTTSFPMFF